MRAALCDVHSVLEHSGPSECTEALVCPIDIIYRHSPGHYSLNLKSLVQYRRQLNKLCLCWKAELRAGPTHAGSEGVNISLISSTLGTLFLISFCFVPYSVQKHREDINTGKHESQRRNTRYIYELFISNVYIFYI